MSHCVKVFFVARMVLKMSSKIIIDTQTLTRTLARLAHEIIEHSEGYEEVYLVGIKRRGVPLAKMLKTNIESFSNLKVHLGELDITLYRDDLSEKYSSPQLNGTQIDFDVTNKNIILVDDVLFTGRTARAAMDAIIKLGRPAKIQLAVIIDRGHRELPICANYRGHSELPIKATYVGKNIPTARDEIVSVRLAETDGQTDVSILRQEAPGEKQDK